MSDREYVTEERVHQIADEVARKTSHRTVEETLRRIGIEPQDAQEYQADMHHLRLTRQGAEQVQRWGKRAAVGAFVSGLCWLMWEGAKAVLKAKGGS
jgi:hypothetical protein